METKAYDWIITSFDPEGDFAQEAMTGSETEIRDRMAQLILAATREEKKAGTWVWDNPEDGIDGDETGLSAFVHFHRADTEPGDAYFADIHDFHSETTTTIYAERLDFMWRKGAPKRGTLSDVSFSDLADELCRRLDGKPGPKKEQPVREDTWRDYIERQNKKWTGRKVVCPKYYGDQVFETLGVDYNGFVKINRRTIQNDDYTPVDACELRVLGENR